jgi:hypothetical protein
MVLWQPDEEAAQLCLAFEAAATDGVAARRSNPNLPACSLNKPYIPPG